MAKKVRHYAKNRPTMEKKEDGKIHIVQLGSYSRPEIKEYYNDDFVAYGEDNDYFNHLIDRYNGGPTNNAAINGISEICLLYTSPSPRDRTRSRMPSSA